MQVSMFKRLEKDMRHEISNYIDELAYGLPVGFSIAIEHKNRWYVEPDCRHEHAGDDLIAIGNKNQRIESMGLYYYFYRVSDEFATGQAEPHAGMVHSDAIADTDSIDFKRGASSAVYTLLDSFSDSFKVHVARDNLIEAVNDSNKWLPNVVITATHCSQKRTVWRSLYALFGDVASHDIISSDRLVKNPLQQERHR